MAIKRLSDIKVGDLRNRLVFQTADITENPTTGKMNTVWREAFTTWGILETKKGMVFTKGDTMEVNKTHVCIVRYNENINRHMRIYWNNMSFIISDIIVDTLGKARFMLLDVEQMDPELG